MYDNTHFMEMTKVISEPIAFKHTIFLDECIGNTSYYRSAIATLKSASENDIITMVFDTEGGLCHTASVFESAMQECKAFIKGELCGEVASAGTKLALACDDWRVGEGVVFMCHTASYGANNSAEKLRDQVEFIDKWITKINTETYLGFLTEEELTKMNDSGKEYWFGAEELRERLENFQQYRKEKQSCEIEDVFQKECDKMEKYENILLDKLVEEGSITEKDKQIALKVQKASEILDKTLSDEDVNNLMNDTFLDEGIEEELPSFMIFDTNDQEYAIVSYEILDGEPIRVELELLEEEGTILVNKPFLQDIPKEELKSILDNLGVKYAWNAGDVRLAEMVEQAITETAKEHLQENLK